MEAFQDYNWGQHSREKCDGLSSGRGKGKKKRTPEAKGISVAMMEVTSKLKAQTSSHMHYSDTMNKEDEFSLSAC